MIKAVLWDNDGVLLDTETLFFEMTKSAFNKLGLNLSEEMWRDQFLSKGRGSREIALSMGGDSEQVSRVMDERNLLYSQTLEQGVPVRPMVRETLSKLSGRVKMAIVTGSQRNIFYIMHKSSGLLDFFDKIITDEDYSNPKPHPEPYLTAVKALNVNAGECIAVEDTVKGFVSAKSARILCMVVPTDLTRMLEFPDALSIEQDVSGILKYI